MSTGFGVYEDRRNSETPVRGAHSISAAELDMQKAMPRQQADGPGEASVKDSVTGGGKFPSTTPAPQQQGGPWCPSCRHHHRSNTSCVSKNKR